MAIHLGGKSKNKKVIVTGCGRMGSSIAGSLSEKGYDVTIIDENEKAFRKLPPVFSGFKVEGDATDVELLKKAGIEDADILMTTADRDNANLMIASIASEIFGVKEVYARFYDEDKERLLEGTEIKAIIPSRLSLQEFERLSALAPEKSDKVKRAKVITSDSKVKEEDTEKFCQYQQEERNEHRL